MTAAQQAAALTAARSVVSSAAIALLGQSYAGNVDLRALERAPEKNAVLGHAIITSDFFFSTGVGHLSAVHGWSVRNPSNVAARLYLVRKSPGEAGVAGISVLTT